MAMMTPASHEFVDQRLREAAEGIEKAQRETAAKQGHKNFELAIRVLYECCTEIDQETENDAVIGHLKTAVVALEAFDVGDVAPSESRGKARPLQLRPHSNARAVAIDVGMARHGFNRHECAHAVRENR
jgi:hypothetical protein